MIVLRQQRQGRGVVPSRCCRDGAGAACPWAQGSAPAVTQATTDERLMVLYFAHVVARNGGSRAMQCGAASALCCAWLHQHARHQKPDAHSKHVHLTTEKRTWECPDVALK